MAYRTLRRFGFRDTWLQIKKKSRDSAGAACGIRWGRDPPPYPGNHKIDHTLVKPRIKEGTRAVIVGRDASRRTRGGLWPSDHAGVVATLRLAR